MMSLAHLSGLRNWDAVGVNQGDRRYQADTSASFVVASRPVLHHKPLASYSRASGAKIDEAMAIICLLLHFVLNAIVKK